MGATHRSTTTAGLVDQLIISLAARSHGVTTRSELVAVGVSQRSIEHRVANGVLVVAHRGVYVTEALRTDRTDLAAATKAVSGSAVARATAGLLHGFSWERWLARQGWHIVGPNGAALRDERVVMHQTRYLPDHHRVIIDNLVVTSPERTVCDLAASMSPARLIEFVQHQLVERRVDLDRLLACHLELARRGRAGTRTLREELGNLADPRDFPQSILELAVQERLVRDGLELLRQFRPPWYDGRSGIVDFADPAGRTILEADGRSFHSTSKAFTEDRRRDRVAVANGWAVVRVGWHDVTTGTSAMDDVLEIIRARRTPDAA